MKTPLHNTGENFTLQMTESRSALSRTWKRQVPNILTFLRIIGALWFPFIQVGFSRLFLLIAIALTDFLDGFFARRFHATSKLGTILDPAADKLLAASCCLTFFFEGSLLGWQIVSLFTREIALCVFVVILKFQKKWQHWQIQSFWIGKIITTLQFLLFLFVSYGISIPYWFYYSMAFLGALSLFELLKRASLK